MAVPSQDQVIAQLRILIPAIGVLVSALGWVSADKVGIITSNLLVAIGPAAIVASSIWSLFANSREAIMKSAAKPVTPDSPAPQIILPREEALLASKLPDNVTSR